MKTADRIRRLASRLPYPLPMPHIIKQELGETDEEFETRFNDALALNYQINN